MPLAVSVALLATGYEVRMRAVDRTLPYCAHIDEHVWTAQAIRILKTGDLNPHRFTKPSVMVYLDTAGFALGMLRAGMKGEPLPPLETLNEGGFPYYSSRGMIRTVRQIYVVLSLVALGLCALVARRIATDVFSEREESRFQFISASDLVGILTFGFGLLSPLYLKYSVWYLSVDLVGCVTNLCAMSYFVLYPRATRALPFALVSGLLVGLCLGTKYNYYPIIVPALGIVLARYRGSWVSSSIALVATALTTFVATTPYALLDLPAFIWSAVGEALHYSQGHLPGRTPHAAHVMEPGLEMFSAYGRTVFDNFGAVLSGLALVGGFLALKRNPGTTLAFVAYPLLLWIYMSKQRAFFDRNLLILQLVVPVFSAVGALTVGRFLSAWIGQRSRSRWWPAVPSTMLCAATLSSLQVSEYQRVLDELDDSRRQVVDWVEARGISGQTVLVANELEMDLGTFPKGIQVETYDARNTTIGDLQERYPGSLALIPIFDGKTKTPETLTVVRRFGRFPVAKKKGGQWGTSTHVLKGNPAFSAVRL